MAVIQICSDRKQTQFFYLKGLCFSIFAEFFVTYGECLSNGYDFISYFFNGLALKEKDKKVGVIDENGNAVLSSSIPLHTIVHSQKNKGYALEFSEDAFVIPIDGEFAIIDIHR